MTNRRFSSFIFSSFLRTSYGIATTYALISLLWIYLSDSLLLLLGVDVQTLSKFQSWKGSGFVCATALLLFVLSRNAIQRLQQSEALYRKVVETIPMGIWVVDHDGMTIDCNSAAQTLLNTLGLDHYSQLRGYWADNGQPLATDDWGIVRALQNGETSLGEKIKVHCDDGSHKTILYSAFPLIACNGKNTGAMALIQDISDKVVAETALSRFRFLIEKASEAVFWIDDKGRFIFVNEQACRSLGYSQQELQSLYLWDIDSAFPRERWPAQQERMKRDKKLLFETCHQRKDGSIFPVEVSANVYTFDNQEQHVAFVRDISIHKKYQAQLEHQSSHDILTGLANRDLLNDRIQQCIRHAERSNKLVALFLLDLDRFKVINDSLGHSQGDNILMSVSDRLSGCIRAGDTLSRLGGDEFAIVLGEIHHIDDVEILAQKILTVFDKPFKLGNRELRITTSMGASLYPRDGQRSEDLLRHADAAMYQAKKLGGNCFQLCATGMDARAHTALELDTDLRQALETREFVLHYQPKVNIESGCIDGCEALVRWIHPLKGIISPGDFIPIAEETGVIISLGEWVLREACRQFTAWQEQGVSPIKIAVNISARQFLQSDFVENIQAILNEFSMDPCWIDLELTESMVMHDPEKVAQTLVQLKEIGFSLSLDDFGTGYSSLNYLRRFPIDHLKIDRSFIIDVASDATAASVANSVISIAHSLGITAIAEGVETWEQYHFLANCHCDSIQGFLFSKPLSADALAKLLNDKTPFSR